MILPRRLRVAPLLLALLLIAGPLAAATHRPHEWQPRFSVTGLLSEAWDLMSRILGRAGSPTFPFEKEGSSGDPFGNPKPTSQLGDSTTATPPSSSGN
jgi:hypothetical protein